MKEDIRKDLVKKLDDMIVLHGSTNPELLKNLLECRNSIESSSSKSNLSELVKWFGLTLSAAKFLKSVRDFIDPE